MNILMIGNKESGKTTYMSSGFSILQKPVDGFWIKGDSSDSSWFLRLYQDILNDRYPMPTDKKNEYHMKLMHNSTKILDFCWKDYYGGVVVTNDDEFYAEIEKSDGIMLFFDSQSLYKDERTKTQVRRILALIGNKLTHTDTHFSVVIVLTKYDTVSGIVEYNEICKPFEGFFNNLNEKENMHCRVIPVSCTKAGMVNVDLPLLYVLCIGLIKEAFAISKEMSDTVDTINSYESKRSIWDWIDSKLNGYSTYGEMADRKRAELRSKIELFETIKQPMNQLSNYVDGYTVYLPPPVRTQYNSTADVKRKKSKYNL